MLLKSEFATVRVELDTSGNGPCLMIVDERTQRSIRLDPLELECLAWTRHEDLRPFLDPSQGRWRDTEESDVPEAFLALDAED